MAKPKQRTQYAFRRDLAVPGRVAMDDDPDELTARAINAQPWQPPPGMVKLRCQACHYWFSARDPETSHCPECLAILRRRHKPPLRARNRNQTKGID
jgi:hypothetical protein